MWSRQRSRGNCLRIAVLAGGASEERDISVQSGTAVAAALVQAGHDARVLDPASVPLAEIAWGQFDACFIALHGGAGEDGRVQRRLELLKVPYTGSRPEACRLAISKSASKERFRQAGLLTAEYELFDANAQATAIRAKIARLARPVVIKPDSQGSSLGVTIVRGDEMLDEAIELAHRYDLFLIAESYICGREFTVAVIDREALPAIEICTPRGFFDYEAKYTAATTDYRIGQKLGKEVEADLAKAAIAAASALGTRGLVRVDLILDDENRPWILELNAVPGMTSHSLAPRAAAAAGVSMPMLCDRLVRECLPVESSR